ncbi:MAG: sulfotransferase family protein [Actinomycetales bacterium]|nr:sulfotransferase family protein [Actinomycetales bacterium]MCP4893136.1 sulfotransferase family protein [Actinomycetales bacterium]
MHPPAGLTALDPLPTRWASISYRCLRPRQMKNLQQWRVPGGVQGYSIHSAEAQGTIFVHVPKCGGSAISESLFGTTKIGHLSLRQYRVMYGARHFNRLFRFAFVRNPWDRLVSAFHYLQGGGRNEYDARWFDRNLSGFEDFATFVREWIPGRDLGKTYWHLVPQKDFLCVEEGRIDLDFVGRLEAVEDDLARLVKLADLNPVGPLARVNTSKRRRDWRSYYDDETAAIVETAYAADIRLLGYAFDPE